MKRVDNRIELYRLFDNSMKTGVEIGVGDGTNAVNILECFPSMQLFLVDPWAGNPRRSKRYYRAVEGEARAKLEPYRDRAIVVRGKSAEFASLIADKAFDFVYIDGDHSYDAVGLDLVLWHRRVKDGGILAGHDYVETKKHGVKRAVDDYVSYYNIKLGTFSDNWYWEVAW